MELKAKKTIQLAAAAALSVGVISLSTHAIAKTDCPVEKCYGIVKKGKNDCGTPKHACAAQSVQNGQRDEWMFVMKGTCDNIVGGHLKASEKEATPVLKQSKK